MSLRLLVADSEGAEAREKRRDSVGQSAGESFREFLGRLEPAATIELATPADADGPSFTPNALAGFDAIFLTGSPLHIYDGSPEATREIAFMRAVFASATPSFGSCAGLQVAVAAAGGIVRRAKKRESGFARGITATDAGRGHPLLAGRPPAWDALTVHGDEVERLPEGAILLASNGHCRVQAAEIRHGPGIFWGVQYHPELTLREVGAALRRDVDTLVEAGLARSTAEVELQAELIEALDRDPERTDLRWRLGVDDEVAVNASRRREVENFLKYLVNSHRLAPAATGPR